MTEHKTHSYQTEALERLLKDKKGSFDLPVNIGKGMTPTGRFEQPLVNRDQLFGLLRTGGKTMLAHAYLMSVMEAQAAQTRRRGLTEFDYAAHELRILASTLPRPATKQPFIPFRRSSINSATLLANRKT